MDNFPTVDINNTPISNCSMPIQESIRSFTAVIAFDSGYEQRRQKGNPLMTFGITYGILPDTAYRTLMNFFLSHTDVYAFSWVHPVSRVSYKVKFDATSFSGSQFSHNGKEPMWSLKFSLLQVW